jgi:hypothetical protein
MSTFEFGPVAGSRIGIVKSLALLAVAILPWPACWDRVRGAVDSARSPELNRAERENHTIGYYESLIGGPDGAGSDSTVRLTGKPTGSVSFREADVVSYLDGDFLQFELKPFLSRNLFGQPFLTNAFGMHDGPISLAKPADTMRIAVLGSSMDMGWGVRYQETYINKLEQWLDRHAGLQHSSPPRHFEVLNFAVAAYSPMQRLEVLRRKVMEFDPDLVIYSATTLDLRLMEIHLCDMLRKNVDLKYDFISQAKALAAVDSDDLQLDRDGDLLHKDRLKKKLRTVYWWLYDVTFGAIAAECRGQGVPLVMVIIPRVGKADLPSLRIEPVARLKSLAAHHGVTVFDLSDTFDQIDPAKLEIAAWDDHPNVIGHHRLFLALARAVVKNQEVYHLLFSPGERPRGGLSASGEALVGRQRDDAVRRAGHLVPRGTNKLPKFDKIVVCEEDDALAPQ